MNLQSVYESNNEKVISYPDLRAAFMAITFGMVIDV